MDGNEVIYGIAIVSLVVGLTEVIKRLRLIPTKYLPLVSLGFGVAIGVIYASPADPKKGVLLGVYYGLSASGLYSGVKNLTENGNAVTDAKPPQG